jgi:hypothetical protein
MNSSARFCISVIVLFYLLGAFASCQANMQAANEPVFGNESVFKMASTPTFSSGTVDTSRTVANKTSIAIDPDDNYPAIAYYDSSNRELIYAKWDGSDWDDKTTVDSSGDVGQYASLAFDASGNPSIGYYDYTNAALYPPKRKRRRVTSAAGQSQENQQEYAGLIARLRELLEA